MIPLKDACAAAMFADGGCSYCASDVCAQLVKTAGLPAVLEALRQLPEGGDNATADPHRVAAHLEPNGGRS